MVKWVFLALLEKPYKYYKYYKYYSDARPRLDRGGLCLYNAYKNKKHPQPRKNFFDFEKVVLNPKPTSLPRFLSFKIKKSKTEF